MSYTPYTIHQDDDGASCYEYDTFYFQQYPYTAPLMHMPQPHDGINSYYPPPPSSYYPPQEPSSQYPNYPPPGGYYPPPPNEYPTTRNYDNYKTIKRSPTVVFANPFNPKHDAEVLHKAMKGLGTNEKKIIEVLCHRTNLQRVEIADDFKTLYGKDLIKELKSELSGHFEDVIVAMMLPLPQYYAKELHHAMCGLGTNENTLIEILCTLSNNEIRMIRHAYMEEYGVELEKGLRGDTSGTFKHLLVSLCNANRDESMYVDPAQAALDAKALYKAGEKHLGTNESTFISMLCQRNYEQLKMIFEQYQCLTGHDIEKAIKKEFSGKSEDALLAIIRSIENRPAFFAKCLHHSMAGAGTKDRELIRLVVTRSEIDMGAIKYAYEEQYKKSLAKAIKGDTSGDYKKCLLALIGED